MPRIDCAELDAKVDKIFDQVVQWRRYIHANPNLSHEEAPTADYIAGELRAMDREGKFLTITQPAPNGVVADLKGGAGDGPIILLRADIDALPVEELADVPFASKKKGVMHACGHDTHAAMLLGAASLLMAEADKMKGTVRLLFQPAEEKLGGAELMVKHGCLDGVCLAFGQHVVPTKDIPTGKVKMRRGAILSSSDNFLVRIIGRGGHASLPELALDPIAVAGAVVTSVQQMVTRRLPSSQAPVLTICSIASSSDSFNVIPDEVTLKGTIRAIDNTVRARTLEYFESVLANVTKAFGATYSLEWKEQTGVTMNHDDAFAVSERVFAQVLPGGLKDVQYDEHPMKASEDFSVYAQLTPSNYWCVGCYNEALGCTAANHNPCFKVDEESMRVGVKAFYGHAHVLLMQ